MAPGRFAEIDLRNLAVKFRFGLANFDGMIYLLLRSWLLPTLGALSHCGLIRLKQAGDSSEDWVDILKVFNCATQFGRAS